MLKDDKMIDEDKIRKNMDNAYETRKLLIDIVESTDSCQNFPLDYINNFYETFRD